MAFRAGPCGHRRVLLGEPARHQQHDDPRPHQPDHAIDIKRIAPTAGLRHQRGPPTRTDERADAIGGVQHPERQRPVPVEVAACHGEDRRVLQRLADAGHRAIRRHVVEPDRHAGQHGADRVDHHAPDRDRLTRHAVEQVAAGHAGNAEAEGEDRRQETARRELKAVFMRDVRQQDGKDDPVHGVDHVCRGHDQEAGDGEPGGKPRQGFGRPHASAVRRNARSSMPKRSASQSPIISWPIVGLSCWQWSAPVSCSVSTRSVASTPLARA